MFFRSWCKLNTALDFDTDGPKRANEDMNRIRDLDFSAFERRQQLDEYVACLKKGMFPLKFAYIGRAAHTHDELIRSREYALADAEAALIRARFASSILPKLGKLGLNVIDVGSGNGTKALIVLEILQQKCSNLKYVGLDYSEKLLRIAVRNILARLPWLSVVTYLIDFEANPFRKIVDSVRADTGCSNLLLFLGHTLGNPFDRLRTLSNIGNSMGSSDTLLVGIELYRPDRVNEVLAHYRNEPFYRAVFNPLTFARLQREDGVLDVSFNESTRDVEVHFHFAEDIFVRISPSELIEFQKDEKLLIFLSHRFDEAELQDMFPQVGLHIDDILLNDDSTYALILAGVS